MITIVFALLHIFKELNSPYDSYILVACFAADIYFWVFVQIWFSFNEIAISLKSKEKSKDDPDTKEEEK